MVNEDLEKYTPEEFMDAGHLDIHRIGVAITKDELEKIYAPVSAAVVSMCGVISDTVSNHLPAVCTDLGFEKVAVSLKHYESSCVVDAENSNAKIVITVGGGDDQLYISVYYDMVEEDVSVITGETDVYYESPLLEPWNRKKMVSDAVKHKAYAALLADDIFWDALETVIENNIAEITGLTMKLAVRRFFNVKY